MKRIYPAIFEAEDQGFVVSFPDLKGCVTEGDSLIEAISMAEDALGAYLASNYERGIEAPKPSDIEALHTPNGFASYITTDVGKFLKNNKAVKKTLTIPGWLNDEAEKSGVNFSAILQNALKEELNV
jgi:predicted RNase H-like HicB family nuclease